MSEVIGKAWGDEVDRRMNDWFDMYEPPEREPYFCDNCGGLITEAMVGFCHCCGNPLFDDEPLPNEELED